MHEMALCRDVVDIVIEEATATGATKVKAVYLTVGYVRDIVEDIFEDMFAWMARGTVAEGAELVLARVPLTVKCKSCGRVYHIDVHDSETWPCTCGVRDYTLETGMEFYINGLDIEREEELIDFEGAEELLATA